MKKTLMIFISILILVSFVGCSNHEFTGEDGLFSFVGDTSGFDDFAREDIIYHIVAYHGGPNSLLKLGKGITVFGDGRGDVPLVVYPVWLNGTIIGVYNLVYYDGQYSGSYSNGNTEELNFAVGKTNPKYPIRILSTTFGYYYSIGNKIYTMNGGAGNEVKSLKVKLAFLKEFLFKDGKIVNVKEALGS